MEFAISKNAVIQFNILMIWNNQPRNVKNVFRGYVLFSLFSSC